MREEKHIFVTESQYKMIQESEKKKSYDPRKVKIVVKYLDDGFQRGNMEYIGDDGYPCNMKIVAMKGSNGNLLKNMTHEQLFYLLQDRFNKIFSDSLFRDDFLKDIIGNWFDHNISREGIIIRKKK